MQTSFDDLSLKELRKIAKCKEIEDFYDLYDRETCNKLLAPARHRKLSFLKHSHLLQEIILMLGLHEPSLPIIMLWNIVGSVTLYVTSLSIVAVLTGGLLLLGVPLYGIITYRELKERKQETRDFFDFAELQEQCHQKLFRYYSSLLTTNAVKYKEPNCHFKGQPIKTSIKNAVGCGILVTVTTFCTYYIGGSAVILAFGLAASYAILTGPIGIGIAAGVAIAFGLYFGIQEYRNLRFQNRIEHEKAKVYARHEANQHHCHKLHKCIKQVVNSVTSVRSNSKFPLRKESVVKMIEENKSLNKQFSFNSIAPKQRDYGTFSRLTR